MNSYSIAEMSWIGVSVFLLGLSKGGFPVGTIALPMLVLAWPAHATEPAKTAVAFMLPLLCAMDIFAVAFYRKHIAWNKITPLLPGAVAGILAGSLFFVADDAALTAISDRALKLWIGALGLLFVGHQAGRKWLFERMAELSLRGSAVSTAFGFVAGLTSTIAHAAGPIVQVYLLPQKLDKMEFAAANATFFFTVNLLKLIPFTAFGRIETGTLILGAYMLPLIPVGVALGYALVRSMQPRHYTGFIYAVLAAASVTLLVKAAI